MLSRCHLRRLTRLIRTVFGEMQMGHLHGGLIRLHLHTGARCLATDPLERRTKHHSTKEKGPTRPLFNGGNARETECLTSNEELLALLRQYSKTKERGLPAPLLLQPSDDAAP